MTRSLNRRRLVGAGVLAVVAVVVAGAGVAVLVPTGRTLAQPPPDARAALSTPGSARSAGVIAGAATAAPSEAAAPTAAAASGPSIGPNPNSGPGLGGGAAPAADTVVRTGALDVAVAKGGFGRAFSAAASIARDDGGFVVSAVTGDQGGPLPVDVGPVGPPSNSVGPVGPPATAVPSAGTGIAAPTTTPATDGGAPTAGTLEIRVPGTRFDDARRQLEALGSLRGEQLSGQDAGGQLADLSARIADLHAEQDGLRALAARATSTGDLLQIQAQLATVQQQLDGLQAQQANLANQVALASITISLSEPPPAAPAPPSVIDARLAQAGRGVEAVAGGTLVVLAYGGPLAVLGGLVALGLAGTRRRRAAAA